jgi:electron transport complex protein RnfE
MKPEKQKLGMVFWNGIIPENPTLRLVLGMCPTIAISKTAMNGIGMGLAATFVLIGSNIAVSALRNFIPNKVRIPAFVVIIATFVTIVDLLIKAFLPPLYAALGIFIPLIVVNCIIIARAEAFASQNGVMASLVDGVGMGLGFTLALLIVSSVREILGAGTWFGIALFGAGFKPMTMFAQSPGGFITLGFTIGAANAIIAFRAHRKKKKEAQS